MNRSNLGLHKNDSLGAGKGKGNLTAPLQRTLGDGAI